MAADFALFLSPEGIALAHRQASGHWAFVGETRLDVDDLGAALAELRGLGEARAGKGFETVLILPDDQILYTSFMAPTADAGLTLARIEEGLEGLTPYPVSELLFDHRAIEADRVKVAVVAQETLDEARAFADAHGFKAVGYAAMPPAERFPGVPVFGPSADAGLAADGLVFGADDWAAAEADAAKPTDADAPETPTDAPADDPKNTAAPEAATEAADTPDAPSVDIDASEEPEASGEGDAADAAATSGDAQDAAPAAGETKPDTTPASETQDEADDEGTGPTEPRALVAAIKADQAGDTTEAAPTDGSKSTDAGKGLFAADTQATAAETPTDRAEADASKPAAQLFEAENAEETPEPAPRPAKRNRRLFGADSVAAPDEDMLPGDAEAEATDDAVDETPKPPKRTPPKATRAPAAPAGPARRITPTIPSDTATRPVAPNDESAGAAGSDAPAMSFSARKGKAAPPKSDAGRIVGARNSRLGFGASAPQAGPSLHPDAAPAAEDRAPTPAGPSRLASQLKRVRDISKPRTSDTASPTVRPTKDAMGLDGGSPTTQSRDTSAPAGEPTPSTSNPFDAPPPESPSAASAALSRVSGLVPSAGSVAGGFARLMPGRRRSDNAPSASASAAPKSAQDTADGALSGGLLARKPVEPAGPSFRTGLILTVILLFLLAGVAIWSVLFLPDSPMARLFTSPDDDVAIVDPLDAPDAPLVVTAPPAIGAFDDGDTAEAAPAAPVPTEGVDETVVAALEAPETAPAPLAEALDAALDGTAAEEELLPDIDADLELAPLPPLPEDLLPSPEEAEALYAQDGIWVRTPDGPSLSPFDITEDVYVASIDPNIAGLDAIALPAAATDPFETLRRIASPPAFGADLTVDERGLVEATPDGVLTPEGAFVIAGRPSVDAIPRPRTVAPAVAAEPETDFGVQDAILGTFRPTQRPGDLGELRERQLLGGLTVTELAERRPTSRPLSAQEAAIEAAVQASLFVDGDTEGQDPSALAADSDISGSVLAVAQSRVPPIRPGNIADIVAAAQRAPAAEAAPAVPAAAIAAQPSIPSNASVAAAATEENAIRLRNVNLIGVTGTPSNRRAMVRLPSGRFVRVGVGDRLDGGRVAAIGENSLQYVRNGRTITLDIPG